MVIGPRGLGADERGANVTRTSSASRWRRWESWVLIVGVVVIALLLLALYLSSPSSFPDSFLPGFS